MPYIAPKEREQLDELIDDVVLRIKVIPGKHPTYPLLDFAGRINYVATQIALKLIAPYRSYWAMALMCGVFLTMVLEFYRRYVAPYETEKVVENGDLPGYMPPTKNNTGL